MRSQLEEFSHQIFITDKSVIHPADWEAIRDGKEFEDAEWLLEPTSGLIRTEWRSDERRSSKSWFACDIFGVISRTSEAIETFASLKAVQDTKRFSGGNKISFWHSMSRASLSLNANLESPLTSWNQFPVAFEFCACKSSLSYSVYPRTATLASQFQFGDKEKPKKNYQKVFY